MTEVRRFAENRESDLQNIVHNIPSKPQIQARSGISANFPPGLRHAARRVGRRPLVCIGINPSTAQPGALDPTLKSVERLAAANGFDSWIMFNVYPQRATDPNDMDKVPDRALCDENLRWLQAVLAQTEPTMWAAWGTLIEKRDYLPGLMREMVALTREREIPWVTFGKRSKKGHPHHPLYLRKDSTPEPFDVENYLDTCF